MAAKHVVLIPGLLCNRGIFAHQLAHLQTIRNVIVLDEVIYQHNSMAAMAKAALSGLPDKFAVAGFSMGGYLALEMAHQAPDRITHLGLISSQAKPDSVHTAERRKLQIKGVEESGNLFNVVRQQVPMLLHESSIPADWEARLKAAAEASSHASRLEILGTLQDAHKYSAFNLVVDMALSAEADGFVRQQEAIMGRKDHKATLEHQAAAGSPILVAWGREDKLIPYKVHHDLVEWGKSASLRSMSVTTAETSAPRDGHHHHLTHEFSGKILSLCESGAGHMLPLEKPDRLTQLLEAWSAAPSRSA